MEQLWATPTAHDGRLPGADTSSTQGANLSRDASLWATPTSHDRTHAPRAVDHGEQLANQASDFHLDLLTEPDGSGGSSKAVLNPSFVEALMGFPPSWTVPTVSARSETPSSPRRPLERSSVSHGGR